MQSSNQANAGHWLFLPKEIAPLNKPLRRLNAVGNLPADTNN